MGIGTSIVIMAIGAILTFAVETDSAEGFDINSIGVILMIAGLIGLLVTLFVWGPRRREVVVDHPVVERPVVERPARRVYRDDAV